MQQTKPVIRRNQPIELPKHQHNIKFNQLLQLPKRQYNVKYNFRRGYPKKCVSNYYQMRLGLKTDIFQMTFDTEPAIPNDSRDLLFECIRSIKKQIKGSVHLITFSGRMLWGLKQLKTPLTTESQFIFQNIKYKFEVLIKPVKCLAIQDLMKTTEGQAIAFQFYNNQIKQILRQNQMEELQRGKFYNKKVIQVQQIGLRVLRGYKLTLCTLKSGVHLQIDACSRVFRSYNLLEEIMRKKSKDFAKEVVGSIVMTNYGRRKTYKIKKIDYDLNPRSKFWHDKRAGQITYAQYYIESYGIKVTNNTQPLVQVVLRTEKTIDKLTNQIIKNDITGYLIPEFISLTGMSDQQRADFHTMREIAKHTKLEPKQRVDQTFELVQQLNKNGRLEVQEPRRINAFQLFQPEVKLFNNHISKNSGDGNMIIKSRLKSTLKFRDYAIVYSCGKNPKYDDHDADEMIQILQNAGDIFGISFDQPQFIFCKPQIQSWKEQIKKDVERSGKPQILILYLNQFEQKFYPELKRFITCQLQIPCQAIRKRTIKNTKNVMSAASKIVVQMNQKIGGTAWEIKQQEQAFSSTKRTMYGSFAISKGKKGFTLAFVGTIDKNFTKVFSYCKTNYPSKEAICQADFQSMFVNWAKNYWKLNEDGPQVIIVYREGLSEQQTKKQVGSELQALDVMVKKIRQKKKGNYKPQITYITVGTKISSRFYDLGTQPDNNRFKPKVVNPSSGTVVMDQLSVNQNLDFFLTAQKVNSGTCTPTHYHIVYQDSKIPIEQLSQFTYEQCFNYYNWTGAVKVPATMQCANKLAKLVGESIQKDVSKGALQTSYFFL